MMMVLRCMDHVVDSTAGLDHTAATLLLDANLAARMNTALGGGKFAGNFTLKALPFVFACKVIQVNNFIGTISVSQDGLCGALPNMKTRL